MKNGTFLTKVHSKAPPGIFCPRQNAQLDMARARRRLERLCRSCCKFQTGKTHTEIMQIDTWHIQSEIRKKSGTFNWKARKCDGPLKWEFSPESGNVDTYVCSQT